MKNLHVAALATLFGISAASGVFASTTSIAVADQDDRGNGRNNHNRNNGNWQNQNGQCNTNGGVRGNDNDNDADDNNGQIHQLPQQAQQPHGRGHRRGWQNPNNPHYCGYNGNCGYNNGQYGQNGQYNGRCNGNGQGNSVIRGTITSVSGNQVTLMEGFGQAVTINDQPALDNQSTGRVVIGRFVTAYGYYQNGIFYATSMQ
ncbi:MAG TPA: DUF5666 domain-containing protein [Candidatus Rubrimentiphilum sp.]|nr:DUF5666 domain-containing protein [Candidatus Rubrimentiphilum sp.]